jgi:hypothetical protein
MSESTAGGAWLTVSQAAAVLGVGERTVQRRCKAGKLSCREVTTESGQRWEVEAATLATGDDSLRQGDDTPSRGNGRVTTAAPDTGDRVTTGEDARLGRLEGYMARDLELVISAAVSTAVAAAVAPLQAELRELRAVIEQQAQQRPHDAPSTAGEQQAGEPVTDSEKGTEREILPAARHGDRVGLRGFLLRMLRS